MSFKLKINQIRRTCTKFLTKGIGNPYYIKENSTFTPKNVKQILVNRPNQRLGNTLLYTPLISELNTRFPEAKIDLFVKGKVAPIVFQNNTSIQTVIELPKKPFKELFKYIGTWFKLIAKPYDLVINIDESSSSGRLATQFARANFKIYGEAYNPEEKDPKKFHFALKSVYALRQFLKIAGVGVEDTPYPGMTLGLNEQELQKGNTELQKIAAEPHKKTIALFTYATGSKCYCTEWWSGFYKELNNKYASEFNIIEILPVENISQLNFILPTFYSKDVREIAAVMHQCELVVAADSGMMHLAVAAPTPTVGLFKYQNITKYKPCGENQHSVLVDEENFSEIFSKIDAILEHAKTPA